MYLSTTFRFTTLVLLCVLTLLVSYIPTFLETEKELLANTDFSISLSGWDTKGVDISNATSSEGLCIHHASSDSYSQLAQCFGKNDLPQRVILKAIARSENVVPGDKVWKLAKIGFVGYDASGKGLYQYPSRLVGLTGSTDWKEYSKDFPKLDKAVKYCVEIALYTSPGSFCVREISLHRAKKNLSAVYSKYFLLLMWVILPIWMFHSFFKDYVKQKSAWYTIIIAALLLLGVLLPNEFKNALEIQLQSFISNFGILLQVQPISHQAETTTLWPKEMTVSKLGHLIGFTILSSLLFFGNQKNIFRVCLWLFLFAACTETLQTFVQGRTPSIADINVDVVGVLFGCIIAFSFYKIK